MIESEQINGKRFLTKQECADYLTNQRGLITSIYTLNRLIVEGKGPTAYQYGGRRKLYNIDDLNEWANSRLIKKEAYHEYK